MKSLSLEEIINSDVLSPERDYLASDLRHMFYPRNGSGPSIEQTLSELLAEAIIEIRRLKGRPMVDHVVIGSPVIEDPSWGGLPFPQQKK